MSSAMALDQSLDTLIAAKRTTRRSNRKVPGKAATAAGKKKTSSVSKKGRASIVGSTKAPAPAPAATTTAAPTLLTGIKINVSNLPPDVKENEIKELFVSTIGPLREVALHFDSHGKSKGMATVVFQKAGDATKAVTQYNNRLIDGTRRMKVELVLEAGKAPTIPTLSQRVAPAKAAATAPAEGQAKAAPAKKKSQKRRRGAPRAKAAPVTVADLDAQMEDYTAAGHPVAAAPAA